MKPFSRAIQDAFTLIELMCVIAIIALLAGIVMPVTNMMLVRAHNLKCANNLRQIGIAANAAANDNDNRYPIIEIGDAVPDDFNPKPMTAALKPYGVTDAGFQCPMDLKGNNNYATYGSSYMWQPQAEDNNQNTPIVYGRRGQASVSGITVPTSRVRLATDWEAVHPPDSLGASGVMYAVYADGHVRTTYKTRAKN